MKNTLSNCSCHEELVKQGFSYNAAYALVVYHQDLEEEIGEELEFNPIEMRRHWRYYTSAIEAANEYGFKTEDEKEAENWLKKRTETIRYDDGILVLNF